jgi:uncharacterized protein (TIGR02284 family)
MRDSASGAQTGDTMNDKDVVDALNKLIETSKDGEYGFRTCAEHMHTPEIQRLFLARAEECARAAGELQALVLQHGGKAESSGTASGALHRGWVAVRHTLSGYSDLAILEEAERGEDTAMARYRSVLEHALPESVRMVVERQFDGVKRNHAQARMLRDEARAVSA